MGKNFARAADAINGFQPGDFLPNMIFLLFFSLVATLIV